MKYASFILAIAAVACAVCLGFLVHDVHLSRLSQERQEVLGKDAVQLALQDIDQLYGQNLMLTKEAQESVFREAAWNEFAIKWKVKLQWDRAEKRVELEWRKVDLKR